MTLKSDDLFTPLEYSKATLVPLFSVFRWIQIPKSDVCALLHSFIVVG